MPAPDLTPQTPGEQPAMPQEPTGNPLVDLPAIAALNTKQLTDALPGLSEEDLLALESLELAGKHRAGALAAIEDEIEARDRAEPAVTTAAPTEAVPMQFVKPILTDAGWVVPEPHQRPAAPTAKA